MENKTRILFVNDEMEMGGVAKVLNNLMANLPQDLFEIDCFIIHKRGDLLNEIPEHVTVYEGSSFFDTVDESLKNLIKTKNIKGILRKCRLLFYMKTGLIKKKIQKERAFLDKRPYDVEVAAKEGFCTIFTAFGKSIKKINWVLTDYSVCNYSSRHMSLLKEALSHIDYNIADSKSALKGYEKVFGIQNGIVIHNLMAIEHIQKQLTQPITLEEGLKVVTVARFHPQKSIERLIKAHVYALSRGIRHHLYLIGDGEQRELLKELVNTLKVSDTVYFMGIMQEPYQVVHQCDLFVLSSLFEGFATVVNESLIATTPVLATRVAGIDEQITHSDYGFIVENNQESLNEGYVKALSNPERLKEMKQSLKSYQYPNDAILRQFIEVFL